MTDHESADRAGARREPEDRGPPDFAPLDAGPVGCGLARRALLLGAGGAGLAAILSACGGGDADPRGGQEANPATSHPAGAGPTATGPTLAPGALARLSEVPVGGGVIAPGDVLVVRPSAGEVLAYDARCPHAGTVVNAPNAGVITCPGHFARFRVADGTKIDGPAPAGLRPIAVTVGDGVVMRA